MSTDRHTARAPSARPGPPSAATAGVGQVIDELDDRLGHRQGRPRPSSTRSSRTTGRSCWARSPSTPSSSCSRPGVFLTLYYVPSDDRARLPRRLRAAAGPAGDRRLRVDGQPQLRRCGPGCSCARCTTGRPTSSSAPSSSTWPGSSSPAPSASPASSTGRSGSRCSILSLANGFIGYSLPDDLISGTGHPDPLLDRAVDPLRRHLPGLLPVRRQLPGHRSSSRACSSSTSSILPAIIAGLIGAHLVPPGAPEAHPVPRAGARPSTTWSARRCSRPSWPRRPASSSWSPRCITVLGGLAQINPIWQFGQYQAGQDLLRRPARLVHGVARRRAAHHAELGVHRLGSHHPLRGAPAGGDLPRAHLHPLLRAGRPSNGASPGTTRSTTCSTGRVTGPKRTAAGAAMIALMFTLLGASATDVLANFFQVSLNEVLWTFRILVFVVPDRGRLRHLADLPRDAGRRRRHRQAQAGGPHDPERDRRVPHRRHRPPARRRAPRARRRCRCRSTSTSSRPPTATASPGSAPSHAEAVAEPGGLDGPGSCPGRDHSTGHMATAGTWWPDGAPTPTRCAGSPLVGAPAAGRGGAAVGRRPQGGHDERRRTRRRARTRRPSRRRRARRPAVTDPIAPPAK